MEASDRQQQQQQSWRIRVTAKAKHFNFRFRFRFAAATNPSPSPQSLSFFRFSILLNLPHFLFTFTSHPKKPKTNKFLQKFRLRNKPNVVSKTETSSNLSDQLQLQEAIRIVKKYCVRIAMMLFFVASVLLKKFKMVKVVNFAAFLFVGAVTMVYYLFLYYNYWEFMGRSVWNKMSCLKYIRG